MKRGKPPIRRVRPPRGTRPIRARKKDPAKRRFAKHRCPEYLAWLRDQRCCISGKRTGEWVHTGRHFTRAFVEATHVRARGAGGDDLYNAVPLTGIMHREQHRVGIHTFQEMHGVDLLKAAQEFTECFLSEFPEFGGLRP